MRYYNKNAITAQDVPEDYAKCSRKRVLKPTTARTQTDVTMSIPLLARSCVLKERSMANERRRNLEQM